MLKKILSLSFIGMFSTFLYAADKKYDSPVYDFDTNQIANFELAYKYGRAISSPKVMMALMNTETAATNTPVGDVVNAPFKRSYGLMQVKLGTYYWMKGAGYLYGENLIEEEILHKLMYNKSFNVYAATSYYKFLLDKCGSVSSAIIAYNTGDCNPDKGSERYEKGQDYLRQVTRFLSFIDTYGFDKYIEKKVNSSNN